ncbi:unnamed protein product [Bursaphelenchus okinawaensis]|uniref:Uncharacterized protein n=1 Tax=Bursaphelenchus okinawaensis TaxID=465554 RepID=A0A811LCF8_9BILA|nr:unnamed protein product [Bursaphelenchus okinawaensis]CAG9120163.1 unnamed protein product [Bursaphelenchus okinawaensis]
MTEAETKERNLNYLKSCMESYINSEMRSRLANGNFISLVLDNDEKCVRTYSKLGRALLEVKKAQKGDVEVGLWIEHERYDFHGQKKYRNFGVYKHLLPTRVTKDNKVYVYMFLNRASDGSFQNDYFKYISDTDGLIPERIDGAAVEVRFIAKEAPVIVKYHGAVRIPNELLPPELQYPIPYNDLSTFSLRAEDKALQILVGDERFKEIKQDRLMRIREDAFYKQNMARQKHLGNVMNNGLMPGKFVEKIEEISEAQHSESKENQPSTSKTHPVAMITNVTVDMGADIARGFLEKNYCVVVHNASNFSQEEVKRGMEKILDRIHFVKFDLTNKAAVKEQMLEIENKFGKIDIMVHLALAKGHDLSEERSRKLYKHLTYKNVGSTKHLLMAMCENGYPRDLEFVTITSLEPDEALYTPVTVREVDKWLQFLVATYKQLHFKFAMVVT